MSTNPIEQIKELADYLAGYAAAAKDKKIAIASEWLNQLSEQICAGGFIGCSGGAQCTSDHK